MEREVKLNANNLDEVIDQLLEYKNQGIDVFYNFNGHILHSKDLTVDSAYKEVTGETHLEFLKHKREFMQRLKKEDEDFLANKDENIKIWFTEGQNYIYPEKESEWYKFCCNQAKDTVYHGSIIKNVLRLMRLLESTDNIRAVVDEFKHDEQYSGFSAAYIEEIILNFSKRGPEFARLSIEGKENVMKDYLEEIKAIEEENNSFEEVANFKAKNK